MKLGALLHFYRQRVRTHLPQELLAGTGIAVGVALVFAVVVANASISTSASQIVRGIAGNATLQLDARDDQGFPASLLDAVNDVPSVEHASGIFEHRAILDGTRGSESVLLVGVDTSLAGLGGSLTRDFIAGYGLTIGAGLIVPDGVAREAGLASDAGSGRAPPHRSVNVRLRGRTQRVPVAAVLGSELIGGLSKAMVVIGRLRYVQDLAGLPGRLSRVLVEPRPGQEAAARRALSALAGGRLTVATTDYESHVLAQAAAPNDQSTSLFAAISALVGFLLAFNAMLLTVPERRRSISELRKHGFTPRQVAAMVVFDATLLGIAASAIGVALGIVLARTLFGGVPTYLSFAFPLGAQQTISFSAVALAFVGGIAATLLAAAQPLIDILPGRPSDAVDFEEGEPGQALGARARKRAAIVAVTLTAAATAVVLLLPSATVVAIAALAVATLLVLPASLAAVVGAAGRVSRARPSLNMVTVAVLALRSARLRSIALAATGAVAVFGSVAIEGAHRDLEGGLHGSFSEYLRTTDLWVTTGGDDLTTESFVPRDAVDRARSVPEVAEVREYFGSLFDVGDRRTWLIARPSTDRSMIPTAQIEDGTPEVADRALRRGGTVAVSKRIAEQQHARVGGTIVLPTPSGPRPFELAATLTNLGWGPGAVVMNAADYRRAWSTRDPTALEVDIAPGSDPETTKRAVQQALGRDLALSVQTADERVRQYDALARDGLERLTYISRLLLAAAAVALAAATGAAIWQRREAFAAYRQYGYLPRQIWVAVLLESSLVLATGCALGALTGIYGQWLLGRWLSLTTGFPAPFAPSFGATTATFLAVALAALAVVAIPSYRAVRAPREQGLQL
jgi:putative ABC transport system permease protein